MFQLKICVYQSYLGSVLTLYYCLPHVSLLPWDYGAARAYSSEIAPGIDCAAH